MKYTAKNIQWDTDGEDIDLPTEMTVDIPNEDFVKMSTDEVNEYISNEISDITGFCHNGFSF